MQVFHPQEFLLDLLDLQVLGRDPVIAHAAGHALALEHAGGRGAGADAADATVRGLVAVGGALAGEAVALHGAGEALALGGAGDVDVLDVAEHVHADLLADLVRGGVRGADLHDVATRGHAGLLEVAGLGLVGLTGVNLAVGDLDGVVAVHVLGAHLGHDARPGLDDGHRDDPVLLVEDLGHAELGAQDALDLVFTHYLVSAAVVQAH